MSAEYIARFEELKSWALSSNGEIPDRNTLRELVLKVEWLQETGMRIGTSNYEIDAYSRILLHLQSL